MNEFIVGFRKIHNSFDNSDYARNHDKRSGHSTSNDGEYDRNKIYAKKDEAFLLISENKLMDTQSAKDDAADPRSDLLIRSRRFRAVVWLMLHRHWGDRQLRSARHARCIKARILCRASGAGYVLCGHFLS